MRRLLPVLVSTLLIAVACGTGDEDPTNSESTTSTTTTTPTPTTSASTSVPGNDGEAASSPECTAYLHYVGAQDGAEFNTAVQQLRDALDDDDVMAALDVLESADADPGDIADARNTLRTAVQPICAEEWSLGVTGMSDGDAMAEFYAAVVAGDRDTARTIAPADVIAEFEPWEPIASDDEYEMPSFTPNPDDSFNMVLEPTVTVYCEVDGGVVTLCGLGE